jgi:hypothetical protein
LFIYLWVRPGAYPRTEHLKDASGASLKLAPALPENIRLGRKSLLGTNNLAYWDHSVSYDENKVLRIRFQIDKKLWQILGFTVQLLQARLKGLCHKTLGP